MLPDENRAGKDFRRVASNFDKESESQTKLVSSQINASMSVIHLCYFSLLYFKYPNLVFGFERVVREGWKRERESETGNRL